MPTLKLAEPWFTQVAKGRRVVSARVCEGALAGLARGDVVTWVCAGGEPGVDRIVRARVVRVARYPTAEKFLQAHQLARILPVLGGPSAPDERVEIDDPVALLQDCRGVAAIQVCVDPRGTETA
jgi:ASC-1-like (ASCH) protein